MIIVIIFFQNIFIYTYIMYSYIIHDCTHLKCEKDFSYVVGWFVSYHPCASLYQHICVGNFWAPSAASHAWDPYGRFGSGNSNEMTASLGA